mgnify:CR=1 FL=1
MLFRIYQCLISEGKEALYIQYERGYDVPRPFVGLNLSRDTASTTFESIAEIRSVLNSTPSIVIDRKGHESQGHMTRKGNDSKGERQQRGTTAKGNDRKGERQEISTIAKATDDSEGQQQPRMGLIEKAL